MIIIKINEGEEWGILLINTKMILYSSRIFRIYTKYKIRESDEHDNLHKAISSLEINLMTPSLPKNNVQEAVSSKNDEVNQLKSTITELRYQLDKAQQKKNSYSKTNTI